MRVHTIEKLFSLSEIFFLIKNIIKTRFEIDENSYTDDLNLLVIGINIKDQSVIIRGSIDKSKNRIYISILALHSNQITKNLNSPSNTIKFRKSIGKTLFDFVRNIKEKGKNYTFTNLKIEKF
jgi:hypothetical protein